MTENKEKARERKQMKAMRDFIVDKLRESPNWGYFSEYQVTVTPTPEYDVCGLALMKIRFKTPLRERNEVEIQNFFEKGGSK